MINGEASKRLKEMRALMGLSQKDVYEKIGMNAGHYSEIEAGRLSAERPLKYLEPRFEEWKKKEIKILKEQIRKDTTKLRAKIKYLESI